MRLTARLTVISITRQSDNHIQLVDMYLIYNVTNIHLESAMVRRAFELPHETHT
jgi:hypothetical protein